MTRSITTYVCGIPSDTGLCTHLTVEPLTQPAPDTGEWRLSSAEVAAVVTKRLTGQKTVPLICIDIPKHYGAIVVLDGPETAAQIISDHNAVPRLVAALNGLARSHPYCWCQTWVGGEHEAECLAVQDALTTLRKGA